MPASANTKKRSRVAQSGPVPKKAKTAIKPDTISKAKRSKPVTVSAPENSDNTDESDEEDGEDDVDFDAEADEEAMDVDVSAGGTRESHLAQKALTQSRKAAKPHSGLIAEAKRVWALARSKDKNITAEKRKKNVAELMTVVRGKIKEIVFKHDASRIIQTLVKYGSKAQREEICDELKGAYVDLARNKYAKFLLLKLVRLLPSRRSVILASFHGHILGRNSNSKPGESTSGGLLLHREASGVLADAFELYANSAERAGMVREFYGKEVALFEKDQKGLVGVIEGLGAEKEKKKRVLSATKENLDTIFNNPDKGAVRHAIVHRAVWEYLHVLGDMQDSGMQDDAVEAEKMRRDLFENCTDILAEMVHTKDGSRVVREFLARGSAKDRKTILKSLKPHLTRMCLDDEAQMVLFTAIDVIDDTKLLQKSLTSHITSPSTLSDLICTAQGRRAILYLLVPRSRRHFTVAQINALAETDSIMSDIQDKNGKIIREGTSKKAIDVRRDEVRKAASEMLLKWVEEQGKEVVRDPAGSLVVGEIMLYADGDKSPASSTLLQSLALPYPSLPPSSHPIDLPHTSRLYKTLLQGGHFNHTTKSVEGVEGWDAGDFAALFVGLVGSEVVKDICTKGDRNGTFVVAELCGALVRASEEKGDKKIEEVQKANESRQMLKSWLSTPKIIKETKEGERHGAKGVKVLLDAIALL